MSDFNKISDQELSLLIKNGEKDAFHELFNRYSPKIFNFSRSYLKNDSDSEELLQEVFLKIWEKKGNLNTNLNIKAYIFKIAINTIYDFIRKKNISNAFNDFANANFKADGDFTWHEVIYNEMLENLNQLVKEMPEQRRKIFLLSKEEGLKNDEIARQLNLSKRTVENQLYRAINFLKTHLRKDSVFSLLFLYLYCS